VLCSNGIRCRRGVLLPSRAPESTLSAALGDALFPGRTRFAQRRCDSGSRRVDRRSCGTCAVPFMQCECTLRVTDDRWADRDHSRRCALRTASRLFIGVYPFRADRRKRQSGFLRPGLAFRNAEFSSPQEEASDLAACIVAGAVDELRPPVRAHARRVGEQMRRRSQLVRTAPPASTRHVQPFGVCFRLALPNFCSSVVGPYRMLSHLSDTVGPACIVYRCADIAKGIKPIHQCRRRHRKGRSLASGNDEGAAR